jgi:hypothetical protein
MYFEESCPISILSEFRSESNAFLAAALSLSGVMEGSKAGGVVEPSRDIGWRYGGKMNGSGPDGALSSLNKCRRDEGSRDPPWGRIVAGDADSSGIREPALALK